MHRTEVAIQHALHNKHFSRVACWLLSALPAAVHPAAGKLQYKYTLLFILCGIGRGLHVCNATDCTPANRLNMQLCTFILLQLVHLVCFHMMFSCAGVVQVKAVYQPVEDPKAWH
jgi:hypothetical protein